jgi:hypothetical protein
MGALLTRINNSHTERKALVQVYHLVRNKVILRLFMRSLHKSHEMNAYAGPLVFPSTHLMSETTEMNSL